MATIEQSASQGDFVVLPMGEYAGYAKSVTPGYSEQYESANLKFVFALPETDDGNGDPVELWAWSSQKFSQHENCKLMNWTKAIFNKDIPDSYVLDTDDLLGRPVMVQVQKYQTSDGAFKNRVLGLVPHPAGEIVQVPVEGADEDIPF